MKETDRKDEPFFVGYLPVPARLRLFLLGIGALLLGVFAALGLVTGASQDDPGDGAFRFDWGRQTVTGILQERPYPVLHITQGTERLPEGRSLLLAGQGKRGMQQRVAGLDGQSVTLQGIALKRGNIDAMQVGGGGNAVQVADAAVEDLETVPLGRWRLSGEICDGKCLAGAMRPGTGLSHRACANLCLIGGIPPVFVSADAVDGEEFFLLADADGGPLPESYLDYVAIFVSIEGEIERRGNIRLFKVDLDTLDVLP